MLEVEQILEGFTRIRFAEWAGDFTYARALTEEVESKFTGNVGRELNTHPLGVLHRGLELLKDRLSHIGITTAEESPHVFDMFKHLRGVVWRIGRNEFEMRAYLNDFNWEDVFYQRVASRNELPLESLDWPTRGGRIVSRAKELTKEAQIDWGRGGSWILDNNNFYREVVISDIGLFRVRGLWTKRKLPRNKVPIIRGFEEVLNDLDPTEDNLIRTNP